MKRNWTALALALGLTLTLTACGGNPGAAETPGSAAPTGSQTVSYTHLVALLQQIDGHQGGLPVVAVEHVWMPVQPAHALHHSPGEVGEALAIVVVAVNVGTLEVVFVVHKPVGDAVPLQLKDAAVGLSLIHI